MEGPIEHRPSRFPRWFAAATVALLAVIAALLIVLVTQQDRSSAPRATPPAVTEQEANQGSGASGSVTIVIAPGMTARDIGAVLQRAGVVKTAQSYIDAANANQAGTGVTAGTFVLHPRVSGVAALLALLDQAARPTPR